MSFGNCSAQNHSQLTTTVRQDISNEIPGSPQLLRITEVLEEVHIPPHEKMGSLVGPSRRSAEQGNKRTNENAIIRNLPNSAPFWKVVHEGPLRDLYLQSMRNLLEQWRNNRSLPAFFMVAGNVRFTFDQYEYVKNIIDMDFCSPHAFMEEDLTEHSADDNSSSEEVENTQIDGSCCQLNYRPSYKTICRL